MRSLHPRAFAALALLASLVASGCVIDVDTPRDRPVELRAHEVVDGVWRVELANASHAARDYELRLNDAHVPIAKACIEPELLHASLCVNVRAQTIVLHGVEDGDRVVLSHKGEVLARETLEAPAPSADVGGEMAVGAKILIRNAPRRTLDNVSIEVDGRALPFAPSPSCERPWEAQPGAVHACPPQPVAFRTRDAAAGGAALLVPGLAQGARLVVKLDGETLHDARYAHAPVVAAFALQAADATAWPLVPPTRQILIESAYRVDGAPAPIDTSACPRAPRPGFIAVCVNEQALEPGAPIPPAALVHVGAPEGAFLALHTDDEHVSSVRLGSHESYVVGMRTELDGELMAFARLAIAPDERARVTYLHDGALLEPRYDHCTTDEPRVLANEILLCDLGNDAYHAHLRGPAGAALEIRMGNVVVARALLV